MSSEKASSGRIIDGKALAASHRESIAARVAALRNEGREVRLDAVIVRGEDEAALV